MPNNRNITTYDLILAFKAGKVRISQKYRAQSSIIKRKLRWSTRPFPYVDSPTAKYYETQPTKIQIKHTT